MYASPSHSSAYCFTDVLLGLLTVHRSSFISSLNDGSITEPSGLSNGMFFCLILMSPHLDTCILPFARCPAPSSASYTAAHAVLVHTTHCWIFFFLMCRYITSCSITNIFSHCHAHTSLLSLKAYCRCKHIVQLLEGAGAFMLLFRFFSIVPTAVTLTRSFSG